MPRNYREVDLQALRDNFKLLTNLSQHSFLPILKANAYGNGAKVIAKTLLKQSAKKFAVASIDEAIEIKENLKTVDLEIISLSPVIDEFSIKKIIQYQITPVISNIDAFDNLIGGLKKIAPSQAQAIWLKVNTGMNRLGIQPKQTGAILEKIEKIYPHLVKLKVIMTHLSSAEEDPQIFTNKQLEVFNKLIKKLNQGKHKYQTSIGNSAFLLNPKIKQFDHITRAGLALYGISPFYDQKMNEDLKKIIDKLKVVASLKAKIIAIDEIKSGEFVGYNRKWQAKKQTKTATLAIGYADGYLRSIPNNTKVLINGKFAKIIGRVSMDSCTVSLGSIKAKVGDIVTLWGDKIDINQIANQAGTISYELTAAAKPRGGIIYKNL